MHFRGLDLNLLVALDALLAESSVSAAGRKLHLSQSAMSGALARLREHFGDPLLVQVGRRMQPTPHARELAATVRSILVQIDASLSGQAPFDPRTARRRIKVAASDYAIDVLLIRVQPDEGISLRFGAKVPGPDFKIRGVRMDFSYGSAFGSQTADAYERLLLDAMLGDTTLFARRDEVEEAWRIVDSIVAGWAAADAEPSAYEAGTWGPDSADALLGEGRSWRRP